jgi:hypothetical protein
MRSIIITLLCIFSISCFAGNTSLDIPKEGDIVFVFSKSRQSPFIAYATGSLYTHCGIIVTKENNLYVLEASNCVKLTPYKEFIKYARWGHYDRIRIVPNNIKIDYEKYLGKKYDLQFDFNNNKMYCSELVYLIYKEQFNIELCKPKQIKEYNILGLGNLLKNRNMSLDSYVVAPYDIFKTKYKLVAPSLFTNNEFEVVCSIAVLVLIIGVFILWLIIKYGIHFVNWMRNNECGQ